MTGANPPAANRMFGSSIRRPEDQRLMTGQSAYVDDLRLPRMAEVVFVRSPHSHG